MLLKLKKIFVLFLSLILTVNIFSSLSLYALDVKCSDYKGSNINANNYKNNSKTIKSYLYALNDNSLIRFQSDVIKDKYYVEFYDGELKFNKSLLINKELEIFGGFYADGNNFYILSGQKNPNEKAEIESFRITKYDKNFKRENSVGLYDCNTVVPFDSGSARFAKSGNRLIIRTSHQMYKSSDGKNHQANLTIQLNTEQMSIEISQTNVSNTGLGYVSHSLNQFVAIENDKLFAVDHGDAYPRSIALFLYHSQISSGDFLSQGCEMRDILTFPGDAGDNYTGASLGGFEYSDSSYLVAYNSVVQDSNFKNNTRRDVYIGVIDKYNKSLKTNRITNANENESFTTPQLVKINSNEFLLLWSDNKNVFYVKLDGKGSVKSDVFTQKNINLSDCQPIVFGDKLIWYEYTDAVCKLHSIDISNPQNLSTVKIDNGHSFTVTKYPTTIGGNCKLTCEKCSEIKEVSTISDFSVLWSDDINGKFVSTINNIDVGQKLFYSVNNVGLEEVTINLSDQQNITFNDIFFTFNKPGNYILTFTYNYNNSIKKAFKITVSHTDANCDKMCDLCGFAAEPTHTFDNDCDKFCNNCSFERTVLHDFNQAVMLSDEQHTFKCSCGEISKPENHSFKKLDSENYICSICSFEISKSKLENSPLKDQILSDKNSSDIDFESSNSIIQNNNDLNNISDENNSSQSVQSNNNLGFGNAKIIIVIISVSIILVISGILAWYFLYYKKKNQLDSAE